MSAGGGRALAAAPAYTLAAVMIEWIRANEAGFWWLTATGVALFIGSLIVVPILAVRIPHDYFAHERRPLARTSRRHPVLRILLLIGKNILGVVFLFAGLAMLVLPGQGLLTIALGFLLLDIPGKYRLERWLVSRGAISRPLNWIRRKAGKAPLQIGSASRR
jgi:archaellum biogenesis protein FlaJ (TadC family)